MILRRCTHSQVRGGERRAPRGFTLLETMMVVGLVGLLSALTAAGLGAMRQRAAASNFVGEFALEVANARALAARRGQSVVVVLHDAPSDPDSGFFVYLDGNPRIDIHDLAAFPIPLDEHPGARLLSTTSRGQARLSRVDWGHLNLTAPFPFAGLLAQAAANPPADGAACSFCRHYDGAQRGAVRVLPDGRYFFSHSGAGVEPDVQGGGLLVAHSPDGSIEQAVAILAPSGIFRILSN